MADLAALMDRAASATAQDRQLEIDVALAIGGVERIEGGLGAYRARNAWGGWDYGDSGVMVDAFTASLDDVLALAKRQGLDNAALLREALADMGRGAAVDDLARAVLVALLGACIARAAHGVLAL